MGGKISVTVEAEQDSISQPGSGRKVVLSEPLDQWEDKGVNYTSFLNELAQELSTAAPVVEPVVKEKVYKQVVEGNPDEFTFKVLLDGAKLSSWGVGDGTDTLVINRHVKINRAERKFEELGYLDPKDPAKLCYHAIGVFLENPFRVEAYQIKYWPEAEGGTPSGSRKADEAVAQLFVTVCSSIVTRVVSSKIKCDSDVDSKTGNGSKVMLTNRIDEYVTMDKFKENMIEVAILLAKEVPYLKSEYFQKSDDGMAATVTVTAGLQDKDLTTVTKMTYDQSENEFTNESIVNGEVIMVSKMRIVWPQVEAYYIINGERSSGGSSTRMFTFFVNQVVAKCESESSLFGGFFG
jgi:hypothetical protein